MSRKFKSKFKSSSQRKAVMTKLNKGDVVSHPDLINVKGIYEGKRKDKYIICSGKNKITLISRKKPNLVKKIKKNNN